MVAQGLEYTIKVKLTHVKGVPDISDYQYIHSHLCFSFSWTNTPHFCPENDWKSQILSNMMDQGLENTIKMKVINLKRGPDGSDNDYIHLLSMCLTFVDIQPAFMA